MSLQETKIENLIQDGYPFQLKDYIKRGWELFKADPVNLILFGAILLLVGGLPAIFNSTWTSFISLLVAYPLAGGLFLYIDKIAHREPRTFQDFFGGFAYFKDLVLASLGVNLLVGLGLLLLFVPGIYLAIAYTFVIPFIVLGGLPFWPSMELSRRLITRNWLSFGLMALMCFMLVFLGAVFLFVGALVMVPFVYCIVFAAYEGIVEEQTEHFVELDDPVDGFQDETPTTF
ncbi:hypothetical protein [Pontibacter sp. G13]|uniref:hypothetical protein n=1 Tax=Pontibacter sp. G13 TaxID=3074898 RepID=UPI00288A261F|nr:hypothetical protein [Pontibacter sp. G13]WNJ18975.1 hypothetical protein RJD25_00670 [Pontibacter sp. G13]